MGPYLRAELEGHGYDVTGLDLQAGPGTLSADLLSAEETLAAVRSVMPEVVFHLAGQADVGRSWRIPQKTVALNEIAAVNLLEAVRSVSIPGLLCGSVLGTALHEAGHAVAALACGGQVFEFGIALNDLVVPGAYALIERKEHTSLWQDLQIDAAGIETNVLLGGLFFHLALRIPAWVDFFTMAGIINLTMMLLNLAGIMGCDGAHILGRLLGIRGEAGEEAGDVLLHRDQREYWLEKGIAGKATLAAYVLILLMQAAIPAMMIVELLGVMACFM